MGDYIYERFTPDRFQAFCSALLVKEYPGYQVFPVGQADGGRDGTAPGKSGQNSIVIQVKFKRQINAKEDHFSWLKKAILDEKDNIDRLIARGAEEYRLITNISATGKADVGLLDRVNTLLHENFDIPVQVLWRDDLDARLSGNYDLKWFYSEILATPDVVRRLFETGFGEGNRRRSKAVGDYIRSQYEIDAFVKFKQADLQASDLLNLFIDVPGDLPPQLEMPKAARGAVSKMLFEILRDTDDADDERAHWSIQAWADHGDIGYFGVPALPAGSFLLHPTTSERFPRVLVEGAPGQGKSTLAQYLCQVHRMHFLAKEDDLLRIPATHRLTPTRIPFRIDLRDLASWIDGLDPRKASSEVEHGLSTSLEAFMSAEVRFLSGGQEFSVSDLHELAATTPIVIVLDGFDEIATPDQRAMVVKEIDKGLVRLSDGALSVQAIVTSRPSAMPDSPTFSRATWTNVALSSITNKLALEYAGRWGSARNLTAQEQQEVTGILAEKIKSPHLSDLARNPMQLTILLSLIHVRGQSLPDQRTALYESYIEVFFNREAEKTRVVRDNRQLLIDLHGYLAWKMHSNAELSRGDGRLTADELQTLIKDWLTRRDHPTDTVEELFQGIVQRIVAIVSRVEGTFEFEVQPLREYFAAHHLYHTAPYSPPGRPESGTKPEILSALMENPYWQNVLRFFAGFYSVGEIPGLATELIERLERVRSTTPLYDRQLSVNLLSDWVFHQQPSWTRKVAKAAVDELTIRAGSVGSQARYADFSLNLPHDCGGRTVGDFAYKCLGQVPGLGVAGVVRRHIPEHELLEMWLEQSRAVTPETLNAHLIMARALGVLDKLSMDEIDGLRDVWREADDLDLKLVATGCPVVLAAPAAQLSALGEALNGNVIFAGHGGEWTRLAALLNPAYLNNMLRSDYHSSLREDLKPTSSARMLPELAAKLEALESVLTENPSLANELGPWQEAVDLLAMEGQPESFAAHMLANIAAGIRSSTQRGGGSSELFDESHPLTRRVRFARMRPNGTDFWRRQFAAAGTELERKSWALHMSVWAGEPMLDLMDDVQSAFHEMTESQFYLVSRAVVSNPRSRPLRTLKKQWSALTTEGLFRSLYIFGIRGDVFAQQRILDMVRKGTVSVPRWTHSMIIEWILKPVGLAPSKSQWRSIVADFEHLGWVEDGELPWQWNYHHEQLSWENLSDTTARKILETPLQFPAKFIYSAVSQLSRATPTPRALGEIAASENWAAS
ncbi:NACHT domain-containing protein [Arthrobacter sp. YN]|uniref:NACHT domain-containing protein n=1 Tax=Arthrobacter sp. YN TaxID=2020486 RepID=UPI000B5FFAD7|nr:NACHT domain-containing protein [Arthrobacter sp. YN]ASN18492.1 hypothetical protein CGK93_01280 [Arthrobacter sp. YN]